MSKIKQRRNSSTKVNTGLELKVIGPITDNQIKAFRFYENNNDLILYGCAGTGKTFISMYLALKQILDGRSYFHKLIIIKTAQPTKQIGHLPGTEKQKLEAYENPYRVICSQLFGRDDAYEILKQRGVVEFHGTSFLRGSTLDNSIILIDEVQNQSYQELRTVVTRPGDHSRVIICGDTKQDDLTSERYKEESGFRKALQVFNLMPSIKSIAFTVDDIVRSGFVREFIIAEESLGF